MAPTADTPSDQIAETAQGEDVTSQISESLLSVSGQDHRMAPTADTPSDQIAEIAQGVGVTIPLLPTDQVPSLSRDEEMTADGDVEKALHVGSSHIAQDMLDEKKEDDSTTSGQNEGGDGNDDKIKNNEVEKSGDVDNSVITSLQSRESLQNDHTIEITEEITANSKSLTMKLLESGGDIRALLLSNQPLSSLYALTVDCADDHAMINDNEVEDEEEQRFVRPPRLRFPVSNEAASDGFPSTIALALRWHPDHMQDRPEGSSIRAAFDTKFDEHYVFRHWRPSQGT